MMFTPLQLSSVHHNPSFEKKRVWSTKYSQKRLSAIHKVKKKKWKPYEIMKKISSAAGYNRINMRWRESLLLVSNELLQHFPNTVIDVVLPIKQDDCDCTEVAVFRVGSKVMTLATQSSAHPPRYSSSFEQVLQSTAPLLGRCRSRGRCLSSYSIVSLSRTVRPCSPWGPRWIGHWRKTWSTVCSSTPHYQAAEESTWRDYSVIACSSRTQMCAILSALPVRGEYRIEPRPTERRHHLKSLRTAHRCRHIERNMLPAPPGLQSPDGTWRRKNLSAPRTIVSALLGDVIRNEYKTRFALVPIIGSGGGRSKFLFVSFCPNAEFAKTFPSLCFSYPPTSTTAKL